MRKILSVAFLAILTACTVTPPPPPDPFIETFDRSHSTILIEVVVHKDLFEVNNALDDFAKEDRPLVYGWSTWNIEGRPYVCQIHTTKPRWVDDQVTTTMGHELAHCVYGRYHKE